MNSEDTIAAIATPIGSAGIGVIRISGPAAVEIALRLFGHEDAFPTHTARHGKLIAPDTGDVIDDAVLTVFRSPHSYTGEDVAEFSCHGGFAVLKAALNAIFQAGARLAEPGEFTKRAFLNGKIDLAQAEAVNDLIRASTDGARKVALRQLQGGLSDRIREISGGILGVIAAIEAAIDFPEDVPEPDREWVRAEIAAARDSIGSVLASFGRGRVYREGLRAVIAGEVNVGKSSLLNALLRHARAIVTPIPGTTRDVIEESLEIEGIPIVAIDTAGLRSTDDGIERIGVELARRSMETADLVLLVLDASALAEGSEIGASQVPAGIPIIAVANKIDLVDADVALETCRASLGDGTPIVRVCAPSGAGLDELEKEIARVALESHNAGESILVSNTRHQAALVSARDSLEHARSTIENAGMIDLLSVDLTAARNSLGTITGETATDDLLDRIFSEFCVGK